MTQSYCRLFLATPHQFKLADIEACLVAASKAGDVASLLIRHDDATKLELAANRLTPIAQKLDIAVLVENDLAIAKACKADGVQIEADVEVLNKARDFLGVDKIVGANCGNNRHFAMALAEAGADYVGLDFATADGDTSSEPICNWWARVFEVPCVVNQGLDLTNAGNAIAAGVDFVGPQSEMWRSVDQARDMANALTMLIKDTKIEAA